MKKRLLSMMIVITMVLIMLPQTVSASITNVYGTPAGWAQLWNNMEPNETITISLETKLAHQGDKCLKFESWGSKIPDHYVMIGTSVPIEPGKSYVYGGYVKAEGATPGDSYSHIAWGNTINFMGYEGTFNWRCFENIYDNTNGTLTTMSFYIVSDGRGGTIWFDSFYCYELDENGDRIGENLFAHGSFDTPGATGVAGAAGEKTETSSSGTATGFDPALDALYRSSMEAESFPVSDMERILGGMKVIGIDRANQKIVIDGKDDDWNGYTELKLPTTSDQYQVYNASASKDVTAKYKYAYDDENFYFIARVEDPVHVAETSNAGYWRNDSLQIGFSHKDESFGLEIGVSYDKDKNASFKTCNQLTADQLSTIDYKASREGIITTYEMAIPWAVKFSDGKPDEVLFTFLINNADERDNREYCVQVSKGISEGKFNSEFPRLIMTDDVDWYSWVTIPQQVIVSAGSSIETVTGGTIDFDYTIVNKASEDRDFTLTINNVPQTVTVPAQTVKNIPYTLKCSDRWGGYDYTSSIAYGDTKFDYNYEYVLNPTADFFEGKADLLKGYVKTLDGLIKSCNGKGISTDYETVVYTAIKEYSDNVFNSFQVMRGHYMRAAYDFEACEKLYFEAKANLEAYLAGTKTAFNVPRYKTSDLEIKGKQFYADVEEDGKITKQPVYLSGFGHWLSNEQIELSGDLGGNITQIVIQPSVVLRECETGYGFEVNPDWATKFKSNLEACEKNNVSLAINLEHHTFPQWLYTRYTDLKISDMAGGFFIRYNIDHPVARAAIETYIKAVAEIAKDYTCVDSYILGNEEMYRTAYIAYYKPYYQLYLTEKYKADINVLNDLYGTNYKTFKEIEMPYGFKSDQHFYDYRMFNNRVFNDWEIWKKNIAASIDTDASFHTKWVDDFRESDGYPDIRLFFMANGMDPELFEEWADINGNDGGYMFDWYPDYFHPLDYLMNADIQTSIYEAPVFNSEFHILFDSKHDRNDKYAKLVRCYPWMSAAHSVAGQVHWFWHDLTWDYDLYEQRPDSMAALGKTQLDMMRLNHELEALTNKTPEVGIVYSQTARVYDEGYLACMFDSYMHTVYEGKKVGFLVDSSSYDEFAKYKTIIVPRAKCVPDSVFENLKKFSQNGGKVIFVGDENLKYNEWKKERDVAAVAEIADKAVKVSATTMGTEVDKFDIPAFRNAVNNAVKDSGVTVVDLIDTATGKKIEQTEYFFCEYNGKLLINLCSWDQDKYSEGEVQNTPLEGTNDPNLAYGGKDTAGTKKSSLGKIRNVKISVNGKEYNGEINDLISGEKLSAEFTVEPFSARLLEISK